ncbi:hypothetical protein AB0M02_11185 [Actinoplanes sp. NPDC051861]|uniref:hypothetical protein n=1 Tax=Actinoplanes sp. NPDC051861 TaxID=3155170 RepID=UPI0034498F91
MTEHGDRLREAFESHENNMPDPAVVYAKVEELARKNKWRRRGVQAAGGVALSAGLIAGVTNLPALLPAGPAQTVPVAVLPAGAAPSASATAPTEAELQARWDAYFGAGYNYTTALELAKLWQMNDEIGLVKAEAGRRLLAGETLPIRPLPEAEVPETSPEITKEMQKQLDAFFGAGYGWEEAEKLAKLWKLDDPSDAKYEAGKRLLAGKKLPVKPDPANVEEAKKANAANAFWNAGYDGEDAQKLAELWKLDGTYEAKVMAGQKILAGEELPIKP